MSNPDDKLTDKELAQKYGWKSLPPGPLIGHRDEDGVWHNHEPRETAEQIEIRVLRTALARAASELEEAARRFQANDDNVGALDASLAAATHRSLLARLEMPA